MQLNSLTINSKDTFIESFQKLAIYDHKFAKIHQQIFIYGKNSQKAQIQTSLHKLNCQTLTLSLISTLNDPVFIEFIMFSFRQLLYFWGKTLYQDQNELYQSDGYKLKKQTQNGKIPNIQSVYAYCLFSFNFLLIFSYINNENYSSKWYIFDIQKKYWYQAFCDNQIPFCQNAKLIWSNGKGYLLLQSIFNLDKKCYQKNLLYEIRFKSFSRFQLKCEKINLFSLIKDQKIIITDMILSNSINLIFIGQQQNFIIQSQTINNKFQKKQEKYIFILNLQTLEWSKNIEKINLIGHYGLLISQQNKLIQIGGILNNQLLKQIQIVQIKGLQKQISNNQIQIPYYEQSRCYNCQQAFTYKQNLIYEPFIQKQYDSTLNKVKLQMKFLNKISKSIISQLQALCNLVDFMKFLKCNQVQIGLKQQINLPKDIFMLRNTIQTQISHLIEMKGKSQKLYSLQFLSNIFSSQISQLSIYQDQMLNYIMQIEKMKIFSLNLGKGVLFVTLTSENKIFVCYISYSPIQFPQINVKSFTKIYYTINLNQQSIISSEINRSIIFQNVGLYCGNKQTYQKIDFFKNLNKKKLYENYYFLYVIGVNNLQKVMKIQNTNFPHKTYEDIVIKNRNNSKDMNGLHKYLKHYYLHKYMNINLLGSVVNNITLGQIFQNLQKNNKIKLKTIFEQRKDKKQLQQTNFTITSDQSIICKNIQIVQKCMIYQINYQNLKDIDKFYQVIFVYYKKKLFKIIKSKYSNLCGIIQLFDQVQILLTQNKFSSKIQQNKFNQWISNIQLKIKNQKGNYLQKQILQK